MAARERVYADYDHVPGYPSCSKPVIRLLLATVISTVVLAIAVFTFATLGGNGTKRIKASMEFRECDEYTFTKCRCGSNQKIFVVPVHQCRRRHRRSEDSCGPCNQEFLLNDVCDNYKLCEMCAFGRKECLTCPKGRYGRFCELGHTANETEGFEVFQGHGHEPPIVQFTWTGTCKHGIVSCPCGDSNTNVTLLLDMCDADDTQAKTSACVPCNDHLLPPDLCWQYRNCKTCSYLDDGCMSCPSGRKGKFCEVNT